MNPIKKNFLPIPEHYGIFPYVVVRIFSATYVQIPLIFCNLEFSEYVQANRDKLPNFAYVGWETDEKEFNRKEFLSDPVTRKRLAGYLKEMADDNHYTKCCLVLSPDEGIYYFDGNLSEKPVKPPAGGVVYNKEICPLRYDRNHYIDDQPEFLNLTGEGIISR